MSFEIQAHRGARAFFPENTIPAFCKAADLGCPVIELDLVVSKDHRIVVSHDPWIPAGKHGQVCCWRRRSIYDMSYEEISAFDCGTVSPSFPGQTRITACKPCLKEVFEAVEQHLLNIGRPDGMIYNLEVKSRPDKDGVEHPAPDIYAGLVMKEILHSGIVSRIRLQSFDYRILHEAHRLNPGLTYGLLIDDIDDKDRFLERLDFVPEYVNPHFTAVDERLVRSLHDSGIRIVPWTVNRRDDMYRMKQAGADGIITDHPELALSLPELSGT